MRIPLTIFIFSILLGATVKPPTEKPMPGWWSGYIGAKIESESLLVKLRGKNWVGTWDLSTFYMSATATDWNVVIWTPPSVGSTEVTPLEIFWPGAVENGTDTSDLLNGNSPFYWIKNGTIDGTFFSGTKKMRFAAIQSQGNIGNHTGLASIHNYTMNRAYADTNRTYLTGLSRGASQGMTQISASSANTQWERKAAVFELSIGSNVDPNPDNWKPFLDAGGKIWMTIGTGAADSGTYGFTTKFYRAYQPLYPQSVYMHLKNGVGHSDWQTEYNPATKRFHGYNLHENLLTCTKSPYAAIGNGSSVSLSSGTTSITLNGVNKEYSTGRNGINPTTLWTKVSGPSATITSSGSDTTSVTGLTAGTYVFRYSRTNETGPQVATADITVTVASAETGSSQRYKVRHKVRTN